MEIVGREHIPAAPPFVIIANHASHLDALILAAPLPMRHRDRIFPIAAGDTFFETPLLTAFAALLLNALPMWRRRCGRHAMDDLRRRLVEEPCAYILFPEGTRSRTGEAGAFKAGLGMIVAGTPVPIVPCRLDGTFEALPPHRRFPRPRKLRLVIGKPRVFESASNDRQGWDLIARECEQAFRELAGEEQTAPP
ncbi:MAG TPA: lysophospholipid acyltransferase family protein [Planctomycetota bacterium]|nr:lysophospholipid acyltransferase family protein [Planctomycetota bacterium]